MELTIHARCIDLPGTDRQTSADRVGSEPRGYLLGLQCGEDVVNLQPVGGRPIEFEVTFRVADCGDGKTNFLGPHAKGTVAERFFYLSWIEVGSAGAHTRYGRVKVHLSHLVWSDVSRAVSAGEALEVELSLTDNRGRPRCGSIRSGEARWQAELS